MQTYIYTYVYDAVGNRTAMTKTITPTVAFTHVYEYDDGDRLVLSETEGLTKVDGQAYTWDDAGNPEGLALRTKPAQRRGAHFHLRRRGPACPESFGSAQDKFCRRAGAGRERHVNNDICLPFGEPLVLWHRTLSWSDRTRAVPYGTVPRDKGLRAGNGDGHRVRKAANGVTTTYVIAVLACLPRW